VRVDELKWRGAFETAKAARAGFMENMERDITSKVRKIDEEVIREGDDALVRLTARFDGVDLTQDQLAVDPGEAKAALKTLDAELREAMEVSAANIRAVATAQVRDDSPVVELPQGQVVTVREIPVGSAGIYAPGGRAAYPSSVLMCAIPAQVAGVERIALVSPPSANGRPSQVVLAAASFCGIEEIYAVGGAQSIAALAWGTGSIPRVDVVVGPGNGWVQEAKRHAYGQVGIDSFAGPSELMLIAGDDVEPHWAAMDLCAQAEHGVDSPLFVAAVEKATLAAIAEETITISRNRDSVADARLALVQVPDLSDAIDLANIFAPEHLELMAGDAAVLAEKVTTAGCVFLGRNGATAFGDYVAGSNHVLPTTRSGRFAGPLGPNVFRRKISTVEVSAEAAVKLAPHVDVLAKAEGFPIHGESAMIRTES
jgi:histidinol dehydrogenase